ncbi:helix-turn-helix domain-containing protein [Candidatus Methylopumilus rimovensis]|uniref:helix-turn-helix domain-containing protein n=1 Tax=Candidatus Methylopumilus rimovensis TaxID=2588535 RepID=UPI001671D059|nr:helix-turn-helix domain-containing protein [Candidatus Methylopumilus rimovensis]
MEKLEYNFGLLKQKRIERGLSPLDIANELCLAERQILSIEENKLQHFPSASLKLVCVRKYAKAVGLPISEVIPHSEEIS